MHSRNQHGAGAARGRTAGDAFAFPAGGPTRLPRHLTFGRLEVAAVLLPLAFLGFYYYLMLGPLHGFFHEWYGFVVLWAGLSLPIWLFTRTVFGVIGRMEGELGELHVETEQLNDRLLSLHSVSTRLFGEVRYDQALQRIADLSRELTGASIGVLALAKREGERRETVVSAAEHDLERANELQNLLHELLDDKALPGSGRRIPHIQEEGIQCPGWIGTGSLACAPLRHVGAELGAICVFSPHPNDFSSSDQRVLEMFAAHGATVVENARLFEEVQALAVEREREQIAREMHDGLAQVLGFVNTKAQAVEQLLRQGDADAASGQMAELSDAARKVYGDIREGIVALRAQAGEDDRTLEEVLESYIGEFEHFARLPVELSWEVDPVTLSLSPVAEVQLLRIVQEALTNVRRHAQASAARVRFHADGETLVVSITDDGQGFEPGQIARGDWPRFGLRAMAERAEAAGGALTIDSQPGHGTTITAAFPGLVRVKEAV